MNRLAYFSETFHESDWKSAPEAKRARDARAKAVRADGYNVKVTGGPSPFGGAVYFVYAIRSDFDGMVVWSRDDSTRIKPAQ